MKIAIDIDNTICNTTDFFGPISEKYDKEVLHKNNVINYNKIVPRSDDWTKEELENFMENYLNKQSINIPVKEDAVIYINKLRDMGFKIIFITNRGVNLGDHTDLVAPKYLEKNNIPYDEVITKSNNKYEHLYDCDYFVDDAIRNCEEALEHTDCKVIMMESHKTRDYNKEGILKVTNWSEIYNYILKDMNK